MGNDTESSPRLRPEYGPEIKTFGVEVECLALVQISPRDKKRKYGLLSKDSIVNEDAWNPVRMLLAAYFDEKHPELNQNVSSKNRHQGADADFKEWIVGSDFTIGVNSFEAECLSREGGFRYQSELKTEIADTLGANNCSRWFQSAKQDSRLPRHREPVQYEWKAVKIISPILPCTGKGRKAVYALYEFLNEHSFVVNGSCGLHVHLGNREQALTERPADDIPLAALRRLASVALCAEYQFTTLNPRCRLDNKFCKLVSSGAQEIHERDAKQSFQLLHDPKLDFEGLTKFMTPTISRTQDRFWAINFSRLNKTRGRANKAHTIEVRSGEPNLRTKRALCWIGFLTQLFEKAVEENGNNPWSWLSKYDENTTTEKFLQDVGLVRDIGKLHIWSHTWDEYVEVRDRGPGHLEKPQLPLDGGQASIDAKHDYCLKHKRDK